MMSQDFKKKVHFWAHNFLSLLADEDDTENTQQPCPSFLTSFTSVPLSLNSPGYLIDGQGSIEWHCPHYTPSTTCSASQPHNITQTHPYQPRWNHSSTAQISASLLSNFGMQKVSSKHEMNMANMMNMRYRKIPKTYAYGRAPASNSSSQRSSTMTPGSIRDTNTPTSHPSFPFLVYQGYQLLIHYLLCLP